MKSLLGWVGSWVSTVVLAVVLLLVLAPVIFAVLVPTVYGLLLLGPSVFMIPVFLMVFLFAMRWGSRFGSSDENL